MTSDLQVNFDLGDYEDYPEGELESFAAAEGYVTVKKDKGNICQIVVNDKTYKTDELELELSGGGWMAGAVFDLPVTREAIDDLRKAVSSGQAKLRLGEYEFVSNEADNEYLFRENYFDFYGN
jgi:hypothetical protein